MRIKATFNILPIFYVNFSIKFFTNFLTFQTIKKNLISFNWL